VVAENSALSSQEDFFKYIEIENAKPKLLNGSDSKNKKKLNILKSVLCLRQNNLQHH